jgi:hypothetical protein
MAQQNQSAAGTLATLIFVAIAGYFIFSSECKKQETNPNKDSSTSSAAASPRSGPQLELKQFKWHHEYDYAIGEGLVTNISGQPMKGVTAVVIFNDKSGSFVTSDDAMIDYNPILPGQSSPFKVMARYNPAMKGAHVEFKYFMGGSIEFSKN